MSTLIQQSNGPLYSIGTLVVDGWAVSLHLVQREGDWAESQPAVPNVTAQPINSQCTNFISFDMTL